MSIKRKLNDLLEEEGYDKYIYLGEWLYSPVYQLKYNDDFLNELYEEKYVIVEFEDEIRFANSTETFLIKDFFANSKINEDNLDIETYKRKYMELYEVLESKAKEMKGSIIRTGILTLLGAPSFVKNLSAFDAGCDYSKYKNFSNYELKKELENIFFEITYPEYCRKKGNMETWELSFYISEILNIELTRLDREIIDDLKTRLILTYCE